MTDYRAYQVSGPRYTSYPSANHFHDGFGAGQWREAAAASNRVPDPAPLSLYLHVPFCTSPCFFCACTRVITRKPEMAARYLEYLLREIEMQAALFDRSRVVEQIHFGGGTPTTLGMDGMRRVVGALRRHFNVAADDGREFGIELDPRQADEAWLDLLVELGFNRVSLGVQDFDPQVQQAVNRVQSEAATLALLDGARRRGFQAINVDLICGLPHQTPERFARTLERVLAHMPDRVAMYSYAHLPDLFKAQRRIDEARLPTLDGKLTLLHLADRMLTDAGYVMIGMDHYALPGDPLVEALADGTLQRNFQGYSTHAHCDLVGLGVSAIGMLGDSYGQNARALPEYYAAIDAGRLPVVRGLTMSADDKLRRDVIHGLMCTGRVDFTPGFRERFASEIARLEALAADGLVALDDGGFTLLPAGRPVMRVVAMVFDAYLANEAGRYSKAV